MSSWKSLDQVSEIADPSNDYNLNIPRYIDSSEPEDLHDLQAHLRGGIPHRDIDALQEYWDVFPSVRKSLFKRGDRAGYSLARVEAAQVKATGRYDVYQRLMDYWADAKKAVKDAQEKLDAKVLKKYGSLSEAEIKSLAIDDNWFAAIRTAIEGEVQRITQRLAERVKQLEERYANPMPELVERVETLSARVEEHLKRMGIVYFGSRQRLIPDMCLFNFNATSCESGFRQMPSGQLWHH
jgi:hypothetical protein